MTDEQITAYLLGELTDEESVRLEEECFAGEEWPAEVGLAGEDLIDAYLQGELTAERRRLFEQNYLTTEERRRRVAMAAGLLRHIDSLRAEKAATPARTPNESSWVARFVAFWGSGNWALRAGLAVGVVALVAGTVWVLRSRTVSPRSFATLTLSVSADSRAEGARAARLTLPADAGVLRVHLKLPDPSTDRSERHRVELVGEGGESSSLNAAGRDGESVTVDIPASRLARGQYALRLFAVEPDGTERRVAGLYYFIVE
jgi:hypothetical protein